MPYYLRRSTANRRGAYEREEQFSRPGSFSISPPGGELPLFILALELLGDSGQMQGKRSTLFLVAGNVSLAYMLGMEGQVHRPFGAHRLFAACHH